MKNYFNLESKICIFLVFEFMNTDLHHVIRKGSILKDIHVKFIMYQLFRATQYLHSGNVIHRDLKPSNVLLDCECNCKIADFGLARSLRSTKVLNGNAEAVNGLAGPVGDGACLTDYVATRWYRAPELLMGSNQYSEGVDLWSLGCILGEMLLGRPLFPGKNTIDQKDRIHALIRGTKTADEIDRLFESKLGPGAVEGAAIHLLKGLLKLSPAERLTAEESMTHPFVSKFYCSKDHMNKRSIVVPPFDDNVQLSVDEYRKKLYELIVEQRNLSGK